MDTSATLLTKEDLDKFKRGGIKDHTKSLIRWMFFYWVLALITYFVFWLYLK